MEVFVVGKCGFINSCTHGKSGLTSVTLFFFFFVTRTVFRSSMDFLFKNRAENSSPTVLISPVISM